MNGLTKLMVGGAGVGSTELVNSIQIPSSGDTSEIIKIVVQLLIGVATLIGLFKKNTPKN